MAVAMTTSMDIVIMSSVIATMLERIDVMGVCHNEHGVYVVVQALLQVAPATTIFLTGMTKHSATLIIGERGGATIDAMEP